MAKICIGGVRYEQDVEVVNEVKPDYVSFVFYPRSKHYLATKKAGVLTTKVDSSIKVIGVFVDCDPDAPAYMVENEVIQIIQLHGNEDNAYIECLKERTTAPIIKAFKVDGPEDINAACASSADYVLLDSGLESGREFDWSLLEGMDRPFFLAGGLNADSIADVVSRFDPYAVSLTSGLGSASVTEPLDEQAIKDAVKSAHAE